MDIKGISNNLFPDKQPVNNKGKTNPNESSNTKSTGDKIEISSQANKLNGQESLMRLAKAELNSIPEVRQERIEDVKGKIASKFYEQEQVISDIAGKMARSEELANLLASENKEAAQLDEADVKKLAIIFNRIDRGFYDKEAVLKSVAEKLKTYLSNNSQE